LVKSFFNQSDVLCRIVVGSNKQRVNMSKQEITALIFRPLQHTSHICCCDMSSNPNFTTLDHWSPCRHTFFH